VPIATKACKCFRLLLSTVAQHGLLLTAAPVTLQATWRIKAQPQQKRALRRICASHFETNTLTRTSIARHSKGRVMSQTEQLVRLSKQIADSFSPEELDGLCFELGIQSENIPGTVIDAKSRQLVLYGRRNGELESIVNKCKELRPKVDWSFEFGQGSNHSVPDIDFVTVPASEFWMGSDPVKDKDSLPEEQPRHRVYVSEFKISRCPVTNAQYAAYAKENHPKWRFDEGKDKHPAVYVSLKNALDFCAWLTRKNKEGKKFRLPTEAEWEKAARGTDGRIYPWGNEFNSTKLNYIGSSKNSTTPVGNYSKEGGDSPCGAADMAGNVFEWTSDRYDANLYKTRVQSDSIIHDPDMHGEGITDDIEYVNRGGSFDFPRTKARTAFRGQAHPNQEGWCIGFRVVEEST
jgi:formylglycine-generating enzyme required for sulfatase activity